MSELEPVAVALFVTELLERMGVRYVIGGSIASMVHGEPRSTRDVDVVADLGENQVEEFVAGLGGAFYADARAIGRAVEEHGHFNLIHLATSYKVDVFVPPDEGFHAEKWQRGTRITLQSEPRREAWVTDPECIVLQKLLWHRDGGGVSERQWLDVLAVLKANEERLDRDYLVQWADRLGLRESLQRAVNESGLD